MVFEANMIRTNPFAFVGANIPSIYGGLVIDGWRKHEKSNLLPQTFIKTQNQDLRQGLQSYSDNKLEMMGQSSQTMMGFKQIKRVCQMQSTFNVNFRSDIPDLLPVYLSIDGENFILNKPHKLIIEQSRFLKTHLTVLRGPNAPLQSSGQI